MWTNHTCGGQVPVSAHYSKRKTICFNLTVNPYGQECTVSHPILLKGIQVQKMQLDVGNEPYLSQR